MTYAIFKAAGFQYRAELGDVLRLPSMDAESGTTVTFDEVLMGSTDDEVLIGRPRLDGAAVRAKVVNHGRADKIVVFKFKRRKNYRRKSGHRQDFTEVRVSEIDLGEHGVVRLEAEAETKTKKRTRKKTAQKESAEAKAAEAPAEKKPAARKRKTAEKKAPEAKVKAGGKKAGGKKAGAKSKAKTTKKPTAEKSTKKKSTGKKKKSD